MRLSTLLPFIGGALLVGAVPTPEAAPLAIPEPVPEAEAIALPEPDAFANLDEDAWDAEVIARREAEATAPALVTEPLADNELEKRQNITTPSTTGTNTSSGSMTVSDSTTNTTGNSTGPTGNCTTSANGTRPANCTLPTNTTTPINGTTPMPPTNGTNTTTPINGTTPMPPNNGTNTTTPINGTTPMPPNNATNSTTPTNGTTPNNSTIPTSCPATCPALLRQFLAPFSNVPLAQQLCAKVANGTYKKKSTYSKLSSWVDKDVKLFCCCIAKPANKTATKSYKRDLTYTPVDDEVHAPDASVFASVIEEAHKAIDKASNGLYKEESDQPMTVFGPARLQRFAHGGSTIRTRPKSKSYTVTIESG